MREQVMEEADDVHLRTAPWSTGDGMRLGWTPAHRRHGAGRGVRPRCRHPAPIVPGDFVPLA